MPSFAEDVPITVDGIESSLLALKDPLARAVIMSLFTWARARPDDATDGDNWGWWGDNVSEVENDRIGSRLWLLSRSTLQQNTPVRAEHYAIEALNHLVEDGVATRVTAAAERMGVTGLAMLVTIYRVDGSQLDLRFANVWSLINV